MQFAPPGHPGPKPRGLEGWLSPLVVGITSVALVIALGYFLLVANTMRGRIPLPPATIPIAMGAAGFLAIFMLLRAFGQFRQAWRAFKEGREDSSSDI